MLTVNPSRSFLDCDEIEAGLFLGNINVAQSEKFCIDHGITHILTAYNFPVSTPEHAKQLFICIGDSEDENILSFFDEAYTFIKNGQEHGACLVHCFAGVSRSATLVIAYLMKKYSIRMEQATRKVKEKRYDIFPNSGFIIQLSLYENMGYQIEPSNINYRMFRLSHLARNVTQNNDFSASRSYTSELESRITGDIYKCRYCRKYLFCEGNIFPHTESSSIRWLDLSLDKNSKFPPCRKAIFLEILPWMEEAFCKDSGKLLCPHCHAKLGAFDWSYATCPCGTGVEPSFQVICKNVDQQKILSSNQ